MLASKTEKAKEKDGRGKEMREKTRTPRRLGKTGRKEWAWRSRIVTRTIANGTRHQDDICGFVYFKTIEESIKICKNYKKIQCWK